MGTTRGGWQVALRLARREAWRRKGQTALMLLLICLPVVAVTAAAVVWRTQDVSGVESIERRMGAADAWLVAHEGPMVEQHFDPDVAQGWVGEGTRKPATLDEVLAVAGADRPAVPLLRESRTFRTDAGVADMEVLTTDLDSPLAAGLVRPVEGTFPPGPGEVVVNRAAADRGPGLGETLTVLHKTADGEQEVELEVVGIAESAVSRGYPFAAGQPGTFGGSATHEHEWLLGGGPVTWDDVVALNRIGVAVASRHVLTDPPPDSVLTSGGSPVSSLLLDSGPDELTITVLALVVVMVLLEVVLLAGPAFAVRAKAQAHALALVAAAGGTPRQARRTVLASGVVVGLVGGVVGVVLGIGAGALAVPVAQRFNSTVFGPFEVPWPLLGVVAVFGFLSALLAAVVPAFAASRQDVVAVLGGRRGEGRPSTRSPILGVVLLGAGVAGAATGAVAGQEVGAVLIAGSALVAVVGMILVVPVVVAVVARLAARLPLALRFAARDAARHRTRTVPAVAAVGATVAGVVALGIAVSSQEAANEAEYTPLLRDGHGSVSLSNPDTDPAAVDAVLRKAGLDDQVEAITGLRLSTDTEEMELEFRQGEEALWLSYWSGLGSPYAVGETVPDFVDIAPAARERADAVLAEGGLVLLQDPHASEGSYTLPQLDGDPVAVDVRRWSDDLPEPELAATAEAPTVLLEVSGTATVLAVFSPPVVEDLGLPTAVVGTLLAAPISDETEKDVAEALAALPGDPYFYVERGYRTPDEVRIIQAVLAALGGILMLGGTLTATFLALSDAKPDLATMAAVGARPRTRRGVAASYALVVGGVGALLGAPVGFIPGVAISQPITKDPVTGTTLLEVPWTLVGLVVVGLPLLTALAVGACARGRLPLTARID